MGQVPTPHSRFNNSWNTRSGGSSVSFCNHTPDIGEADSLTMLSTSRYDAVLYSRTLGNRSPGTHNLCLIEDADHIFMQPGVRFPIPTPKRILDLFSRTGKQLSGWSSSGTRWFMTEYARPEYGKPGCGPGCKCRVYVSGT